MQIYDDEIHACTDCLLYLEADNDDPSPDWPGPDAIDERWPALVSIHSASTAVDEDTGEEYEPEPWFSWSACHVCGSHLGGDRHLMVALCPDEWPLDDPNFDPFAQIPEEATR